MTTAEITKEERNTVIRQRLLKYWHDNFQPSYKLIAEHIDLSYINLRRFANQHQGFGKVNLDKIDKFLTKQGY